MNDFAEVCKLIANRIYSVVAHELMENPSTVSAQVGMGADGTPTKLLDKLAEDAAIKVINQSGLKINLLSEEAGFVDRQAEYTLVLDPLDGTRNACRNLPFYCTSIAIGRSHLLDVEYGLIMNLPTKDLYEARRGKGAYLNGRKIKVRKYDKENALFSFVSGRSKSELSKKLLNRPHLRALGACALEMALVASGALDGYLMVQPIARITDIAAGALLVKEGGGRVYNAKGEVIDMPFNVRERTSLLALSCEEIRKELL
jgi:fructose-1,6-bisphosphatase/inositol monophosphatase family enzyme